MNNKQQHRNKLILERLIKMNEDEDWAETVAEVLEIGLEEVALNDGFGTSSRSDPRGDGRDGNWGTYFVQGFDK